MESSDTLIYIPLLPAIAVYLIYVIFSTYLFGISGGLGEVYLIYSLPPLWLILLIARFFTSGGYISKYYFFGILIAIAIFQILSVLFNVKGCWSESSNSYNYIQEIIVGDRDSLCRSDTVTKPWIPYSIDLLIGFIYWFCNLIFIVSLISADRNIG